MELRKNEDSFVDTSGKQVNVYRQRGIGKFRVVGDGCCIIPPNWCNSIMTWIMIVVPSVLQMVFVNSAFQQVAMICIQIAYVITMALALTSLSLTTFTDPGIIPTRLKYES